MSLKDLFWSKGYSYYPTDKDTHHSYLNTYSDLFLKWKDSPINLLEVGTYKGGSMKLFEEYFTKADIIGYDIIPPEIPLTKAKVIVKDFYSINPQELPELTIAIDDGPHGVQDQLNFLKMVYPKILPGGILIIEDVRADFRPHFETLGLNYTLVESIPYKDEDNDRLLIFRK